ncbi:hydroxymethylglutaryl-CoA lyase [Pseudopelagicola sp. nBUS_20]|uniref:hydroxymethylglutaryl-CoA lyase n=1 Tax=Pseudopelagicola sp. nBUS_20 TaxID=3395317 RepID=UPI003EBFE3E4
MSEFVEIFEMGPRDGLQNERNNIPTADKISLVNCLSKAGFKRIEVGSFVSPRWVPQMADSAQVLTNIQRQPGVSYTALTPNMQGFNRAVMAQADEIAIFGSASEGFSKANINATIAESLERFGPVIDAARSVNLPVRGYISCVTDCPFDGPTSPKKVAQVAAYMKKAGCYEISLGDTIGQGTPESILAMLTAVLNEVPADELAGHYHDTAGRALINIEASLQVGLRVFDAAVGGLGGCPYAPGAAGNVATEAVNDWLIQRGYLTGLKPTILETAAGMARDMRSK